MEKNFLKKAAVVFVLFCAIAFVAGVVSGFNSHAAAKVVKLKTGSNLSSKLANGKIRNIKITSANHSRMIYKTGAKRHICSTGKFAVKTKTATYNVVVKQRRQNGGKVAGYVGEAFEVSLGDTWTENIPGNKWVVKSSNKNVASVSVSNGIFSGTFKAAGKTKVTMISPCGVKAVYTVETKQKEEKVTVVQQPTETVVVSSATIQNVESTASAKENETVNITVKYINTNDGSFIRDTESKKYDKNATYSIEAPVIEGYSVDKDKVSGTAVSDITITFNYTKKVVAAENIPVVSTTAAITVATPATTTTTTTTSAATSVEVPTEVRADQIFLEIGNTSSYDIPEGYFFVSINGRSDVVEISANGSLITGLSTGYVKLVYVNSIGSKIILPVAVL